MDKAKNNWSRLVFVIQPLQLAVRIKCVGNEAPTSWEPWLVMPVPGYLETGSLGPIPFREIEWVEVDPALINQSGKLKSNANQIVHDTITKAFMDAGIKYQEIEKKYRISSDDIR